VRGAPYKHMRPDPKIPGSRDAAAGGVRTVGNKDQRLEGKMTQPDEDYLVREDDFDDEDQGLNDLEAPADDALEQAIPANPADLRPRPQVPFDVNEADALEQARIVEIDDDYR
jgi:hypothetical protein